jgi:CubicO group peptidase (beta-lactamase class C family)
MCDRLKMKGSENIKGLTGVLFMLVVFLACNVPPKESRTVDSLSSNDFLVPGDSFPEEHWQLYLGPQVKGWNSDALVNLEAFIKDSCHTTAMMVIHGGAVIFQHGDIHQISYIASCRKSVLAMLYGPFVENGRIKLNSTLAELQIDDVGGLLPIEKTATVENLLVSRSGIYHPASNGGDQSYLAPGRGTVTPGESWLYNNWDFNAAGFILEKQTGKDIYKLVDSLLAGPLQMEDWDLLKQSKSGDHSLSIYPAYHMFFSTADMARIGYLMLKEGNWKGKQIISPAWIRKITTPVTSYEEALRNKRNVAYFGYGYRWWCWDNPAHSGIYSGWYTAMGAYGQYITVFPKLDLVVVHKNNSMSTNTSVDSYLKILFKILAAKHISFQGRSKNN